VIARTEQRGEESGDEVAKQYSDAFKAKMVERMTGRSATSASQLQKEVGVSQTSLSKWLDEARSLVHMSRPKKPKVRSIDEKIRILAEGGKLTGEELPAFLEKHGVRLAEFEGWRLALDEDGRSSKAVTHRIRALERDLARKDAALAEAAALLLLKKKLQAAFGVEDDDTDEENEK
jgi:transposase-like protein